MLVCSIPSTNKGGRTGVHTSFAPRSFHAVILAISFVICSDYCECSSLQNGSDPGLSEDIGPGVVVEKVIRGGEADRAGLKEGDLVLNWSRGAHGGVVGSPFEFAVLEIEEAPRGTVAFEGLRNGEKREWILGPDTWGLEARPNLHGALLSLYSDGQELAASGKLSEAAGRWRVAAEKARSSQLRRVNTWFLLHAAELLDRGDARQVDDAFRDAIAAGVTTNRVIQEQILRTWADRSLQRNETDRAESLYREAFATCQEAAGENLTMALDLYGLGLVFHKRYDAPTAKAYFEQSLAISEKLAPDSLSVADTLQFVGREDLRRGDLQGAERYLLRALRIAQTLAPETVHVAASLWFLGVLNGQRVDLVKAEQYLRRAIEIEGRVAPNSIMFADMLGDLGNVIFERGDLATAEEYYLRELSIASHVAPDSITVTKPLNNLGNLALQRRDLVRAEAYIRQALAINEKLFPESHRVAGNLNNLGRVFKEYGNIANAAKYYEQALAIREKQAPGSLEVAESLNFLADIFETGGDLARAEEYYSRALAIRQKLAPGSTFEAETLAAVAGIMSLKQDPTAALKLFSQSLSALESQTARLGGEESLRSGFRAKYIDYYKAYIDLLITQKQPELAFQTLERSRARILLEMLTAAHVNLRESVDASLIERERALQVSFKSKSESRLKLLARKHTDEELRSVDSELETLLSQYNEIEGQIRTISPRYAGLTQTQPLGVKEVQQRLLGDDTTLLEYELGKRRSYVFVVSRDELNVHELPKRADIEGAARRVYELLNVERGLIRGETKLQAQERLRNGEMNYATAVAELSHMVLEPAAMEIKGKRLLIVSDGALQYIPFAILPAPGNPSAPLMADYEIVSLPSASTLATLRREFSGRNAAPKTIAILADPVFDARDDRIHARAGGEGLSRPIPLSGAQLYALNRSAREVGISQTGGFPRLPFTRREADAIYSIANQREALRAVDFDASKDTALSPQLKEYRILHFATHGLLNGEHPELSGLVFSLVDQQGNSKDGFLQLLDIYNLELSADLVVISACQTALGKQIDGEGMVGLTRGFMYAGVPRVMASLWKVDDEATAALMKKFYEGVLKKGETPSKALRSAQMWMRTQKSWKAPYYWAGFVMQGEWK